jgi:monoamine oxidase
MNDQILSFFDPAQQMLTVYCTGKSSSFSPETIQHSYIAARPMMEMSFGKDCPPFIAPTYAEDRANLICEGPIGYSWPNDPYARGSYSYIAKGQEDLLTSTTKKQGEVFKALFAPIGQNLYFAGEHTSILFEVQGTMEAACESGERVARTILKNRRIEDAL